MEVLLHYELRTYHVKMALNIVDELTRFIPNFKLLDAISEPLGGHFLNFVILLDIFLLHFFLHFADDLDHFDS